MQSRLVQCPGGDGLAAALEANVPVGAEYFRNQAKTLLALAEATMSRPEVADRLRMMAAEFLVKAAELDADPAQHRVRNPALLEPTE